jgi:hypothetical protein
VDINFKDGNKNATLKPYQPASDFINYYTTGTSEAGVTNVHHFQKVVYENVYPNIDIEFVLNDASNKGKFKYNFIVKPNGNLADIQLEFLGANHTSLNQAGNILIETAYGNIEENIPLSYVINNNNSHSTIKANFITLDNNIFGINVDNYNHNQTLVIDPTNWATYFGESGVDFGNGIATDANGNSIIIGTTSSTNAIATIGAHQTIFGGNRDAYIVKFNTTGTRQWATYYGESDFDYGNGIATDTSGNIIAIGSTSSSFAIATTGSHQTAVSYIDAFIAKFNNNGIRQWATYYGGSNLDEALGVAIDKNENIIITGYTRSTNAISSISAHQTTFMGVEDAFIAKFNSSGVLQWATYFGGTNGDIGNGIASDADGNILIIGQTYSTSSIASIGAHQTSFGSGIAYNAFIAKFSSSGVRQWSTYYGGTEQDYGNAIITDNNRNIIIIGQTYSNSNIATIGSHQGFLTTHTVGGQSNDAFIAKFNTNGIRQWATYYGGGEMDYGTGITVNASGDIIILGYTLSTNNISTTGTYQINISYGYDTYIAKFNASGVRQWATYFGGTSHDYGQMITTDPVGNIIVAGYTESTNGIATIGVHQTIFSGGTYDAFIVKFSATGILPIKLFSFNATLTNEKVNCAWETASETNNDYFSLERSKDGNSFEAFGNVKGQGNSNWNIRYSYIDNNPFSGMSYYRLKQTDFDGKYTYSTIKKVGSSEKLASKISLFYENNNPIVKINSLTESNAFIELINLNGVKLLTNEQPIINGENTFAINSNINAGFYLLKVQLEDKVEYFKVWIK